MSVKIYSYLILCLLSLFLIVLMSSVQANSDCCSSFFTNSELMVITAFTTYSVGPDKWDLSLNVTWVSLPGYEGYDVEVGFIDTDLNFFQCWRTEGTCYTENENTTENWREFKQIQFSSTYKIKIYISKFVDNLKGKFLTEFVNTPDCYEETGSIEFCKNATVGYIGKPFNISIADIQPIDTSNVNVRISWRQPLNANPETPLDRYHISWALEEASGNVDTDRGRMTLSNITYQPGEHIVTELESLRKNAMYSLHISPVVLESSRSKIKSEASTSFSTHIQDLDTDLTKLGEIDDNGVGIVVPVSAILIYSITTQFLLLRWIM